MFEISDKIINFMREAVNNWEVKLTEGKQTFTKIKI